MSMDLLLAMVRSIDSKLEALISALAEDDGDVPPVTLDGHPAGAERDQTQGLG